MLLLLGSLLVITFTVVVLEDGGFNVQLRGFLATIGWYNADKKKGWRLVQDGNDEFNLQKFNSETFTWDTFEHFTNVSAALNRYNRMNDMWEVECKCRETFKKEHEAQKKYESNAKKIKKVIK